MSDEKTFRMINPANGETIDEFSYWHSSRVSKAIERAEETFHDWSARKLPERAECLLRAADLLESEADTLAARMAREMGKPLADGRAEATKCAWVCRYYAERAGEFLRDEAVRTLPDQNSFVSFRPIGAVLAVMPWNFPLWQVFRFAAPGLMAGNVGLLKHASNVMGTAREIERILLEAGCPEGAFTNLEIDHEGASEVMEHPLVRAVTLTGSTAAGRSVAAKAGEMLKKTVLELGGSDAYVVLEDADLDLAATICARSRLLNSGQSCIAAKRFIVVEEVREAFEEKFVQAMKVRMGDPFEKDVEIGPQARFDLRDSLHEQVTKSLQEGARCLLGGKLPEGEPLSKGAFYPPTVLTDAGPGMTCFDEELFGPVATVISAKDEADAVRLANTSRFGLGGAVFSTDAARAERIARDKMDTGNVAVNSMVASDPRLPFGGVKDSGYGRELGAFGIREFVNIKTLVMKMG